ncbi:MAG TPA: VWA domain-containing protein [Blastocatellia bacterium]|nr:VWA domain-containing protein [Blastocatellia bacterium]
MAIKRSSAFMALTVISVLFIGIIVFAQQPQDKTKQSKPQTKKDDQLTLGTLVVRLPITVKEKNKFVGGLTKNNFEVYEDGKRQEVLDFIAPSQLPLNIAMMIDTSSSVKLKLPFEKDAGEDFVTTVTTFRRKDQVLLASFDSGIELHQDFTDNLELLIRAIRKLKAGGFTKLYDGVYRIIEEKMATLSGDDSRRIIVVLSDGADTASEHTLRETIEMAQGHDVTIFGISTKNFKGIDTGTVESSDDKDLRKLCEATGGQVFLPSQKADLFRAFTQVAMDLRQEYVIFYRPINQQKLNKPREIKVKLVSADGRLYHKEGYRH